MSRRPKLAGERLEEFRRAYWHQHDNTPQQIQRRFQIGRGTYQRYVKIVRTQGRRATNGEAV